MKLYAGSPEEAHLLSLLTPDRSLADANTCADLLWQAEQRALPRLKCGLLAESYRSINSNGDAEPCVFIHFSDSNIRDKSILEILQSPLFKEYHKGQPFNRNHLRPCPMLENPTLLWEMIERTGAHQTNLDSPESVEHLCAKCDAYAETWKPVAEEYWQSHEHKRRGYENYSQEKTEHSELAAFEHAAGN